MKASQILALGTVILVGMVLVSHRRVSQKGGCTKDKFSFGLFKYEGSTNC